MAGDKHCVCYLGVVPDSYEFFPLNPIITPSMLLLLTRGENRIIGWIIQI